MADPEVKLKFLGNSADAERAIATLEKRLEKLEQGVGQLSKKNKGNTNDWESALDGVAAKYLSIGAAATALGGILNGVVAENLKLKEQLDSWVPKQSEAELKLQIQGALTKPEAQALLPGMEKSLTQTPSTDLIGAYKLQTQLASSGFKDADVKSGEALKTVLELKAATNQFGEAMGDESEAVKSLSMLLKAGGSEHPSAKEMRELGGSIVSLFESSDVQFPDFKQLAPKITGLKEAGLSMEESISAFSALTDIMGGNKADSGLAQFVTRTATAGAFKERAETLEQMGLKPSDVAMAKGGKGFIETIDLMREKTSKMTPEARNNALAKLYGEEAGPAANFLLSDSGNATLKDYLKKSKNREGFERNVETFNESRYAQQKRTEVKDEFATMKIDNNLGNRTWKEEQAALDLAYKKQLAESAGPGERFLVNFGRTVENFAVGAAQRAGVSPNELYSDEAANERVLQKNQEQIFKEDGGGGKAVELLETLVEETRENTNAVREGNRKNTLNRSGNRE